ncbi:Gfo/Idh/MocA family oxidoreductase [Actinokineospora bangkokensis]|uniref:Gfo/Idh/MocA-like oxidoreductase N-terminal domain-containing protein n=1 Tax=Actinokineospora bangkokensis TaxID=1193682 RepID=A0A1Q9LGY2_9PSEU|nr:Gfo/Idh/MocA family oxidoreductase [Actinokineospora bangkokensis]OLR91302.1 hypothetical protein BJP25_26925 [Actinokineospora bangkokensis]
MLSALVVGAGRAGAGLHLPVLRGMGYGRGRAVGRPPIVVVDPGVAVAEQPGVVVAPTLAHAASLLDPARTAVHLCTPPTARLRPLTELAGLGFRHVLVEKPLATSTEELAAVLRLREAAGLDLVPVAQWRCSELTRRIAGVVAGGELGALRSIVFTQTKPRFGRTLRGDEHPTAFDVEVPHSLAVALSIAGPARVTAAGVSDMLLGDAVFTELGGAWVRLAHRGARTEIRTDLTAPVRERRITVELEHGTLVGHYPVSAADEYAQLLVRNRGAQSHSVFRDDSLTAFIARAHEHFAGGRPILDEPATGAEVVRLLDDAKRLAARVAVGAAR